MSCPRIVARKVPPLLSGMMGVARLFPVGEKCHGASAVQLGANRSYPLPYAAPPLSCGLSLSRFSRSGGQNGERVSRSDQPASSACGDDGLNELDFQTALYVLVQALMGIAACVYELPGTELVYVASAVPKNLLHGLGVPGLTGKLRLIRSSTAKPAVQRRKLRIGGVGGVNVADMAGVIERSTVGLAPDADDRVLVRGIGGKLRLIGLCVRAAHAAAAKDIFPHPQRKARSLDKRVYGLFLFHRQTLRKGGGTGSRAGPPKGRGIVRHRKIKKRPNVHERPPCLSANRSADKRPFIRLDTRPQAAA